METHLGHHGIVMQDSAIWANIGLGKQAGRTPCSGRRFEVGLVLEGLCGILQFRQRLGLEWMALNLLST